MYLREAAGWGHWLNMSISGQHDLSYKVNGPLRNRSHLHHVPRLERFFLVKHVRQLLPVYTANTCCLDRIYAVQSTLALLQREEPHCCSTDLPPRRWMLVSCGSVMPDVAAGCSSNTQSTLPVAVVALSGTSLGWRAGRIFECAPENLMQRCPSAPGSTTSRQSLMRHLSPRKVLIAAKHKGAELPASLWAR